MDDFAIASPNKELSDSFLDALDENLKQKLKSQDVLSSFNALDAQKNHITLRCHAIHV